MNSYAKHNITVVVCDKNRWTMSTGTIVIFKVMWSQCE